MRLVFIHFYVPELTRLEYREMTLEFSENISVFFTYNCMSVQVSWEDWVR